MLKESGSAPQTYAATLLEKVKEIDGVTDADSSFEATQPELRVTIDRQRAADLGVSPDSLSGTMRTLIGGEEVSKFKDGDEQFSVRMRLDEPFRNNPATMGDIFVPASGGRMVRLTDVAHLSMGSAPGSIDRFNLSDLFEYVSAAGYQDMLEAIVRCSRPGARLAYWNMLAPRQRPDAMAARLRPLDDLANRLHREDRAFFYSAFRVEQVQ